MNIQAILTVYGSIAKRHIYIILFQSMLQTAILKILVLHLLQKILKILRIKLTIMQSKKDFLVKKGKYLSKRFVYLLLYGYEYFNKNYLFENFENYIFQKNQGWKFLKISFILIVFMEFIN